MKIEFSKHDTLLLKGIGMILIMFHNFFHWTRPNVKEIQNEFYPNSLLKLYSEMAIAPLDSINLLFSYFGHYGVQLFIFISGYGLAKSYNYNLPKFYVKRIKNTYKYLIIGIIGYVIWFIIYNRSLNLPFTDLLIKLLYIDNFLPGRLYNINGPWWFFSLIVQLYLLFPILNFLIKKYPYKSMLGFFAIYFVAFALLYQPLLDHKIYFYGNFIGHFIVFSMGIFISRKPDIKFPLWTLIISLLLFFLACVYLNFYSLNGIAITVIMIMAYQVFKKFNLFSKFRFLEFVGILSPILFAIHGYLRMPLVNIAASLNKWHISLFISIVYFFGCLILSYLIYKFLSIKYFGKYKMLS